MDALIKYAQPVKCLLEKNMLYKWYYPNIMSTYELLTTKI